jgi:hypothetical protein
VDSSQFGNFAEALRTLARRLGRKDVDTETATEAFEDLRSFPWPVVTAALETLRKTSRFFPRPQQLIDACHDASREYHSKAFVKPDNVNHEAGQYACDVCQDTGFERGLECDGTGVCHVGHCGHEGHVNQPHAFTRRCACRPTNPVLIHARALSPRFATTDRS